MIREETKILTSGIEPASVQDTFAITTDCDIAIDDFLNFYPHGNSKILGLTSLNTIFQLQPTSYLTSADDVSNYLEPYIRNAFEQLAAADYPYNTSFYDVLPGWSVNVRIDRIIYELGVSGWEKAGSQPQRNVSVTLFCDVV